MRLRKSLAYRGALPPVISLLKLLVDEVLRWESPGQFLMRQVTPDVEISGTIIPAGALVMVRYWRVRKWWALFAISLSGWTIFDYRSRYPCQYITSVCSFCPYMIFISSSINARRVAEQNFSRMARLEFVYQSDGHLAGSKVLTS